MAEEFNPFQSPTESASPDETPAIRPPGFGKTPHAKDFANLALQLKVIGGFTLLVGLLLLCASWWCLTIAFSGLALLVLGYGLAAYKPWAWVGALVVLVPMSIVLIVATIAIVVSTGKFGAKIGLLLLMGPAYMWYVLWVLCSRNGRQRYRETREAILRARANPDSIAGKLLSGRVRGRL